MARSIDSGSILTNVAVMSLINRSKARRSFERLVQALLQDAVGASLGAGTSSIRRSRGPNGIPHIMTVAGRA